VDWTVGQDNLAAKTRATLMEMQMESLAREETGVQKGVFGA